MPATARSPTCTGSTRAGPGAGGESPSRFLPGTRGWSPPRRPRGPTPTPRCRTWSATTTWSSTGLPATPFCCSAERAARLPPAVGDRQAAVAAEVAGGDLRARRVLAPLVLSVINHGDHPVDQGGVVPGGDELRGSHVLDDVVIEDGVQRRVVGQRVGVELAGRELGARWLEDRVLRDRRGLSPAGSLLVAPPRQLPDQRFGHVLDRREPTGRVSVQGRV